tara:strand:+ start:377 stop:625 length:249 start_codon:yes stop_codon:yes gene_type:complete
MFYLITQSIHGTSGTELPPDVEYTKEYLMRQILNEPEDEFHDRVRNTMIAFRQKLDAIPPAPSSICDGVDWRLIDAEEFIVP